MLLSAIIFFPMLCSVLICLAPNKNWVRPLALVLALIEFVLSLAIFAEFDKSSAALQLAQKIPWIHEMGIYYSVGIDGISLWLVMLTTFLTPIIVLGSWTSIGEKLKGFHACLFFLEAAMLGSFLAMDAILFYVFFELSLVPMYFMVGIWGGQRRIYATVKFFIFTMVGSLMMLLGIIYLMYAAKTLTGGQLSASVMDFYQLRLPFVAGNFLNPQTLLFFAFALAFAIKVPMFPFHTWLPDAHVEAPTPGSVVLAGVMLKMGTYGFMRFVIPLFPEATEYYSWLFLFLGVIGIIYGALVAMVQPDIKKLVAYSSISHMGYVMIGLFSLNVFGMSGGLYQMLNHGISTGALFLLVGMIYERTHSREIVRYGGLAKALPIFTIMFFIITLSSIAVPLTNGFVGEFLILVGTFMANRGFAILAVTGVILGAVYMLWMFLRVFYGQAGELVKDAQHPLHDMSRREIAVMVPMIVMVFWMGLMPNTFLSYSKASIDNLVEHKDDYKLTVTKPAVQLHTNVSKNEAQK